MKRSNFYLLIGSFLMLGCSQPEPPKVPSKPATESKAADPKVLMKLVAADRLDGKEDKVIEKCLCLRPWNGRGSQVRRNGPRIQSSPLQRNVPAPLP